ncbi:sigma-70 family RNA polymerase sigma factor [Fodinicurvata sp. EGI_FJ10296]|uniref:sigma-70 family RNA polymerase sigma factor n=1 Tax=Fodinicurvata sp. EGI_FJ10296 TaxID=3231908 RepID=UPI0034539B86
MPAPNPDGEAPEAISELLEMIPALRAFARSFCRSPYDADDLVQETLMKGIANIDKFQPGTNMKSWLFTIMRNTFYTGIKVYNRECPGAADCVSSKPSSLPSQEWGIRGSEITQAVFNLPYEQREVTMLISMLGMSYPDAAEICDCSIGTIKSRLSRARQKLLETTGEKSPTDLINGKDFLGVAEQRGVQ